MELWNDFEGKVVDDRYRLGRLLAPKGRSAFFTATTLSGEPVTMRLIESLNDEDEILARWRVVEGIHEPHLQTISASGKTVLDGTHLVYAAMEPTEMSLDEVLRERMLNGEETRQMAGAVVAGLEALHKAGLVHEHVDAPSVLARAETVKLRSDCVREAPGGAEGEALKRRDAHDLAVLVGYALTQRRDPQGSTLPRQFEDLVRNGINGTWGMKEMSALLRPAAASAPAAAAATTGARPGQPSTRPSLLSSKPVGAAAATGKEAASPSLRPGGTAGPATAAVPAASTGAVAAGGSGKDATGSAAAGAASAQKPRGTSPATVASALLEEESAAAEPERATAGVGRPAVETEEQPHRFSPTPWIAAGAAALVLLLLIWHFSHRSTAPATPSAQPAATAVATAPATARPSASTSAAAGPGRPATRPDAAMTGPAMMSADAGTGTWRVITYTYMHREQADRKAEQISAKHPELRAQTYAPTGSAPYLVALGNGMTEREAAEMRNRARRDGLPRDTFIRNYHGR